MDYFAFSDTYQDLRRLDAARSRAELLDALLRPLERYGICKSIAGLISPQEPPHPDMQVSPLFAFWADDWFEHYIKQNYYYVDPVCHRQTGPHGAARWRDAFADSHDKIELQIMGGARECGLGDGFTFAFPMSEGGSAMISLAGPAIDCSDRDVGSIALLTHFAIGKAICLGEKPEIAPTLTPRERDVLLWTCEGKTEWEIGAILGVSEHSADQYVRKLKSKLKATSKTQLVARAFRLGLV